MSKRPSNKIVKEQLFLACGRIDMYNMKKYAKTKLQLHHYPKYEHTHHTTFEESYLLSDETHKYIHSLEHKDPYQFYLENEYLWYQKQKILSLRK